MVTVQPNCVDRRTFPFDHLRSHAKFNILYALSISELLLYKRKFWQSLDPRYLGLLYKMLVTKTLRTNHVQAWLDLL